MKRTTKILLTIGAILVLSYPGIAWVTGFAIESHIQHNEERALAQAPYFTLVKREYHRGVYRSTQIATYGLRNPLLRAMGAIGGTALPAGVTITVTSDIRHGPLPGLRAPALAIVDSTVAVPPALRQALSAALGSNPMLRIHTVIGLLGGASIDLTGPAFSLRLPAGATLAWGGLTGSITTARNQARWSDRLSAPRIAIQAAQGGIELAGIEYSGAHRKALDELHVGTDTLTIERVNGNSLRSGGDYSLQRISVTGSTKADGEFFDIRADVAADSAKVASLSLKNLMYSASVEHVHGPTLASMVRAIRAAQRQAALDQTQLQAGMHDAFRQYGGDLLLHDPVIDIRQVSFAMPEGSLQFSAKISAPGLARADLQWPAAIAALRSHAAVTADLRIDNGLLQKFLAMGGASPKIASQLALFERQGYLTAGPGTVTTHLDFSGGRLTLNGHPFPPAAPAN
jgi:uncharacterized protein YdgA (DUF945 family)